MKDRLVTIVLSVATTYGLMQAGPEPLKQLEVDRLIVRDGKEITGPLRIEGSQKEWTDKKS